MDRLNNILEAYVAKGSDTKDKLLGAAFTVVNKNGESFDPAIQCRVLYQGSAGRTDLPPDSKPWGPDTVSWIASMTKLASAISVLQIVEQGLVTLDEDVRPRIKFLAEVEILRGFDDDAGKPILEPNTRPITLRQLLTHTTGLAYDLGEEVLMKWRRSVNKDMINMTWTEEGFSTPLLFPPGTDWNYGTSIDWATAVLEKVTGQKLSEYMAEHILDPLEMRDTGFWPVAYAKIPFRGPDGGLEDAPSPVPTEHPVESGGAGLFSTTADYAKLLRAVLQGKLLSESSMDLLFTPQLSGEVHKSFINKVHSAQAVYASEYPPGMPINFGLGGMLNLENIPGKRAKGSMQWSGYTNPHWFIDRETGVAAVLQASVLPYADPSVAKLYDELERTVYADLL